jgi:uncharacterized protein YijF (DUF1287 family)
MTTRAEIVAAARSQIGVPCQHQAAVKDVACDCIGLLLIVAGICRMSQVTAFLQDSRFKAYSRPPNPRLLISACDAYLDRIPILQALPGDIALGRIEKEPQHFGIISSIDPPRIIHAYSQVGKVAENGIDDNWRAKVVRMYRFRGIE